MVKIAVSIPNPLFDAADRVARSRNVSRSQLYAQALELLLESEDDRHLTERLDLVHGSTSVSMDARLADAQAKAVAEEW